MTGTPYSRCTKTASSDNKNLSYRCPPQGNVQVCLVFKHNLALANERRYVCRKISSPIRNTKRHPGEWGTVSVCHHADLFSSHFAGRSRESFLPRRFALSHQYLGGAFAAWMFTAHEMHECCGIAQPQLCQIMLRNYMMWHQPLAWDAFYEIHAESRRISQAASTPIPQIR